MVRLFALLVLVAGSFCPAQAPGVVPRYLYWLTCSGVLEKLDTLADQKVATYDLPAIARTQKLFPEPEHGAVDGCLAYEPTYDAAHSLMYFVIPEQYHNKAGGTKDYKLVALTLPGLRIAKQIESERNLEDAPFVELIEGESPKVVSHLEGLQTKLDVSGLSPDGKQYQNRILEISGGTFLLDLFENKFAVANPGAKTLTRLENLPPASYEKIHLTPGGAYVLVERTDTNSLALYDSKTGTKVADYAGVLPNGSHFLAISPSGRAIYYGPKPHGLIFKFIDLHKKFANDSVARLVIELDQTPRQRYFFAGK